MNNRLPKDFRKLPIRERRSVLEENFRLDPEELACSGEPDALLDLADVMVESAAGFLPLPMGIAGGFLIDGTERSIPMATEEPSVIAAASYGARMIERGGGITTEIDTPVMTAQVFIEDAAAAVVSELCGKGDARAEDPEHPAADTPELQRLSERLADATRHIIPGMTARGGGYRGCDAVYLPDSRLLRIQIHIDVRDAMGANVLNTAAEQLKPLLQGITGGRAFMAILTNDAARRHARAEFRIPLHALRRRGIDSRTLAGRIALASTLAQEDPARAVTHNKGIMNGVTALALATGNDTRGLEAAVHRYAARSGRYRGISTYRLEDDTLIGQIELPVPLGAVGGAVGFHPVARTALQILGIQGADELGRIAAALGLAQNLAAVSALVSEGIQHGHMRFHAHRLAYQAGARGREIPAAAAAITASGVFNLESAQRVLQEIDTAAAGAAATSAAAGTAGSTATAGAASSNNFRPFSSSSDASRQGSL